MKEDKEIQHIQTKTWGVRAKIDTERGSGILQDKQREGIIHRISDRWIVESRVPALVCFSDARAFLLSVYLSHQPLFCSLIKSDVRRASGGRGCHATHPYIRRFGPIGSVIKLSADFLLNCDTALSGGTSQWLKYSQIRFTSDRRFWIF